MQVKTLPRKVKTICQQHPENIVDFSGPQLIWEGLMQSVLWSDESTFHIVFGNHGHLVLQVKGHFSTLPQSISDELWPREVAAFLDVVDIWLVLHMVHKF